MHLRRQKSLTPARSKIAPQLSSLEPSHCGEYTTPSLGMQEGYDKSTTVLCTSSNHDSIWLSSVHSNSFYNQFRVLNLIDGTVKESYRFNPLAPELNAQCNVLNT